MTRRRALFVTALCTSQCAASPRYNLNAIEPRVRALLERDEIVNFEAEYDTVLQGSGITVDPDKTTAGFTFADWEAFVRDGEGSAPSPKTSLPFWKACDTDLNGACSFGEYVRARGWHDAHGEQYEQSEWDERETALAEDKEYEESVAEHGAAADEL